MNIGLLYFVLAAIVLIVIGVLRTNSTLNSIYCEHDYVLVGRFIKHGQNGLQKNVLTNAVSVVTTKNK